MRSIFYTSDEPFAASSHASLIAAVRRSRCNPSFGCYIYSDTYRQLTERYLPGAMTPWAGIRALTANCALNCNTRAVTRIWPRRAIQGRGVSEVSDELCRLFRSQMENITRRGRPVLISLTGGIDSRTTLSASHVYGRSIRYFTYGGPKYTRRDVKAASELAALLRLDHKVVAMTEEVSPFWHGILDINCFNRHRRGLPATYARHFSDDTIHIRTIWRRSGGPFPQGRQQEGEEVAEAAFRGTAGQALVERGPEDIRVSAVEEFGIWTAETGFWSVEGVDPYDLFYWEHRMSCWHGNVVLESDAAFDTVSLFNCRYIIEAMLSVPIRHRLGNSVQRQMIETLCPAIAPAPLAVPPGPIRRRPRRRAAAPGEA